MKRSAILPMSKEDRDFWEMLRARRNAGEETEQPRRRWFFWWRA